MRKYWRILERLEWSWSRNNSSGSQHSSRHHCSWVLILWISPHESWSRHPASEVHIRILCLEFSLDPSHGLRISRSTCIHEWFQECLIFRTYTTHHARTASISPHHRTISASSTMIVRSVSSISARSLRCTGTQDHSETGETDNHTIFVRGLHSIQKKE